MDGKTRGRNRTIGIACENKNELILPNFIQTGNQNSVLFFDTFFLRNRIAHVLFSVHFCKHIHTCIQCGRHIEGANCIFADLLVHNFVNFRSIKMISVQQVLFLTSERCKLVQERGIWNRRRIFETTMLQQTTEIILQNLVLFLFSLVNRILSEVHQPHFLVSKDKHICNCDSIWHINLTLRHWFIIALKLLSMPKNI